MLSPNLAGEPLLSVIAGSPWRMLILQCLVQMAKRAFVAREPQKNSRYWQLEIGLSVY